MTTFDVPDELARRLAAAASARGISVDDAVVEAFTEWSRRQPSELAELTFVGIGAGRPDLAERHDELLGAFIGSGASGHSESLDIDRERAAAADAKRARGV